MLYSITECLPAMCVLDWFLFFHEILSIHCVTAFVFFLKHTSLAIDWITQIGKMDTAMFWPEGTSP